MNNSNSSPLYEWLILIGAMLIIAALAYHLARLIWKAYRLFFKSKRDVQIMNMRNVLVLRKIRPSSRQQRGLLQ